MEDDSVEQDEERKNATQRVLAHDALTVQWSKLRHLKQPDRALSCEAVYNSGSGYPVWKRDEGEASPESSDEDSDESDEEAFEERKRLARCIQLDFLLVEELGDGCLKNNDLITEMGINCVPSGESGGVRR
ncbi:hypothetical protein Bbelb_068690 [Branchiostoma belcheri]|nr:hypothetical protein Bbelb_068690 [Branchiostoma belcheri]